MTALPLALRQPTLAAFLAGQTLRLRRPADGIYSKLGAGDRLWIREPFRLESRYNSLSPTAADERGAEPFFAPGLTEPMAKQMGLGPERYARCLLRDWHRHHALVTDISRVVLQGISEAECRALGYRTVSAFAADWDRDVTGFTGKWDPRVWDKNPTVLAITIEPKLHRLPQDDPYPAARQGSADLAAAIANQGGIPR